MKLFLVSIFFFFLFAIKHVLSSLFHFNNTLDRSHHFVDTFGHKIPVQFNQVKITASYPLENSSPPPRLAWDSQDLCW